MGLMANGERDRVLLAFKSLNASSTLSIESPNEPVHTTVFSIVYESIAVYPLATLPGDLSRVLILAS